MLKKNKANIKLIINNKTNIKKMREYVDFINNDPRIDTSVITCGDGLAISVINNI